MRNVKKVASDDSHGIDWAISALRELVPDQHQFFTRWLSSESSDDPLAARTGYVHCILQFDQHNGITPELPEWVTPNQRDSISRLVDDGGSNYIGNLSGELCVLCINQPVGKPQGRLILLGIDLIASVIPEIFPDTRLTRSELRVLLQLMIGYSLKEAAQVDNVSYETKRSQLKAVFVKTGTNKQAAITSILLSHILINFGSDYSRDDKDDAHEVFYRYHRECLPAKSRRHVVVNDDGSHIRMLDFGSISGMPVISPHHLGLVYMTDEENELFETLGIRLIVPLRNGALGPLDPLMLTEQHLRHAMDGIRLAQNMFCGGKANILAPLSSCFYALHYAHCYPDAVDNLIFVGASYKTLRKQSSAERFRTYLHGIAMGNRWLMPKFLQYLAQQTENSTLVRTMFDKSYADSPADLKVIEKDFADPRSSHAFELKIRYSLISIQHDLYYQALQDWSQIHDLRAINIHFIHGVDDRLHPYVGIEQLVNTLANAKAYPIEGAGSFIYHDNTPVFLKIVRDIVRTPQPVQQS